jgi:hypothetical protein
MLAARHVFMKPQFSTDGAYLHLASLEAQEITKPKASKSESREHDHDTKDKPTEKTKSSKPTLQLSLFLTTHRLSQHKTTRSPPNLIHRSKLSLGLFSSISVAQMPLSLAWTPTQLYCTVSGNHLRVFRIELFKAIPLSTIPPNSLTTTGDLATQPKLNSNITVPKNDILLPDSTRVREIRYYPSSPEGNLGTILIGSLNPSAHRRIKEMSVSDDMQHSEELPDVTSPPIGLFIKEDDLGGWVGEEGREEELNGRRGKAGGLERKIERFDAEDDCKL